MLILTRRVEETLCIGTDVRITVLSVHGKQVRIDIRAPKDLVVDREEVHQRKQREAASPLCPTSAGTL
jgi:carbon storage regulator